jgi:hypothetical protein
MINRGRVKWSDDSFSIFRCFKFLKKIEFFRESFHFVASYITSGSNPADFLIFRMNATFVFGLHFIKFLIILCNFVNLLMQCLVNSVFVILSCLSCRLVSMMYFYAIFFYLTMCFYYFYIHFCYSLVTLNFFNWNKNFGRKCSALEILQRKSFPFPTTNATSAISPFFIWWPPLGYYVKRA